MCTWEHSSVHWSKPENATNGTAAFGSPFLFSGHRNAMDRKLDIVVTSGASGGTGTYTIGMRVRVYNDDGSTTSYRVVPSAGNEIPAYCMASLAVGPEFSSDSIHRSHPTSQVRVQGRSEPRSCLLPSLRCSRTHRPRCSSNREIARTCRAGLAGQCSSNGTASRLLLPLGR